MEQEKNNRDVIALLIVIIVILLALVILLATGTIKFKSSYIDNNNQSNESDNNIQKKEDNDKIINDIKTIFTNPTVRFIIDNSSALTFCPELDLNDTVKEADLGLKYTWNGLRRCNSFNTYKELTDYIKLYFTDEYFNNLLENHMSLKENFEVKSADGVGETYYNYYEKDGKLYVSITGKGSDVSKIELVEEKITYNVDTVEDKKIKSTIVAVWLDAINIEWKETIRLTLIKNNEGIWKIDKYEIIDSDHE